MLELLGSQLEETMYVVMVFFSQGRGHREGRCWGKDLELWIRGASVVNINTQYQMREGGFLPEERTGSPAMPHPIPIPSPWWPVRPPE